VITFDLQARDNAVAIISTDNKAADLGAWARLAEAFQRGIQGGDDCTLKVTLNVLLAELEVVREVSRTFGARVAFGDSLRARIAKLGQDRRARETALTAPPPDSAEVRKALMKFRFRRELRPFQLANLGRILALPHAADFSVPGAGKTSVALANYVFQKAHGRVAQALVVAPISAFPAWREESSACFDAPPLIYVHSVGQRIPVDAEILLTNYHRLVNDFDALRNWAAHRPTHVFLDEAHRMKRGREGVHGRATLELAFDAERRDILTGTPTPQGAYDLVALIEFLYPGQARQILPGDVFIPKLSLDGDVLRETNRAVQRYFVRTCKTALDLPPTEMKVVIKRMGPLQDAIYAALRGIYRGELELSTRDRRDLHRMGQIVMYLLEAATNPLLLPAGSDEFDPEPFAHPPLKIEGSEPLKQLLKDYGLYERPWKYDFVAGAVKEAAGRGEKTLVWTNFVRNIRLLEAELKEFRPAVIHGGVPGQDSAPNGTSIRTREGELDRFRNDAGCQVLLANPAAAGEGVSLHHWCHHAIYVDRTFNAGHFLQSQDRIHRLGLDPKTLTRFTLLMSEASIDETVDLRLRDKVSALSLLLDDPGLVRIALPTEDDDDGDGASEPAFQDDLAAVRDHVGVKGQ
jgi:SNF2 family DNA or RNA helicase